MGPPETRYARNGDVHLAYQVTGTGAVDVLYLSGFLTHLEHAWELPGVRRFNERLGAFARVIRTDRRGVGLSDRVTGLASVDKRIADALAILDAAESHSAVLLGVNEGGAIAAALAAAAPERATGLALYGSFARFTRTDGYDIGMQPEAVEQVARLYEATWGDLSAGQSGSADEAQFRAWLGRLQRLACSPGEAADLFRNMASIDVREALPRIVAPTVVIHRSDDPFIVVDHGRYLAEHIPGARLAELEGTEHLPFRGDIHAVLDEVEELVTGARPTKRADRILAAVLFTDIVGSTERAAALGDHEWRTVLDAHDQVVRKALTRYGGTEVVTTGDGFLATFDNPAGAVRCALDIADGATAAGVEVRAGVHFGEVERRGEDVAGLAVHVGARLAALAGPSEVVVSRVVADLMVGSWFKFEDRGTHTLKGVPGEWTALRAKG